MSENDNVKVRVRNLTKCFGDFVCIVGPTGCGKTTFLKCLVRLFSLTEGEILVDGEPADPKKHNLSFVFQNPSHLPWLTVEKNIRYGLELKKYPEQLIRERTEEILGLLGLDKVRNSYPHELSASTVQRIVIGRSFAMHPDLLLMDEPHPLPEAHDGEGGAEDRPAAPARHRLAGVCPPARIRHLADQMVVISV